jgi:CBS domain containing-hemolysin-like protein
MTTLLLLGAAMLLAGNALFVAAEFAAVSVRRSQIEPLASTNRRARRVLLAQQRLSVLLAGAQLGITLCSLGLGAVAEPAVATVFEHALDAMHLPVEIADPLAFAVALALVVLAHMVIGEMVPKNIALASSERAALLLVPALDTFARATGPLIRALNALANRALQLGRIEPQDELKSAYTPDELANILAESRNAGYLDASEHQRLASALSLAKRTAGDVMIPAANLVTVTPSTTTDELESLTAATGYSRFPVIAAARSTDIVGFVHVKDILTADHEANEPWAAKHLHAMPHIDPATTVPDLLTEMRRARSHMGLVADGTEVLGVVALEDAVAEFVGEISDASHTQQ